MRLELGMQDLSGTRNHPPWGGGCGAALFPWPLVCRVALFPHPLVCRDALPWSQGSICRDSLVRELSARWGSRSCCCRHCAGVGNCVLHIALFKRLFACRCESLGCAEPEGRTHGTGATRCTQLPSPLTAAQASTHLMSYANPWLPESWDFLLFSFALIFECLALEDVKKN